MHRAPDYYLGRFFLSPLLGCTARCSFCYIFTNPQYSRSQKVNQYGILPSVEWIASHPCFRQGNHGSIVAIGAWGDPFPRFNEKFQSVTLEWLRAACQLGNPIQLMSRFRISETTVDAIAASQQFPGQILYSTSIVTFQQWPKIERGTDSPFARLQTLKDMKSRGVSTNVMIKPFIPGLTDVELDMFIDQLTESQVEYCVVGALQWDDLIASRMMSDKSLEVLGLHESMCSSSNQQILDCSSDGVLNAFPASQVDVFADALRRGGLKVFKKSACVTSHLSQTPNAELLFFNDHQGFCVGCGVCPPVGATGTLL